MNKISEIDIRQRLVRCEAGVTLGQLNSALALHGLAIPVQADPNRTIGGLIADSSRLNLAKKPHPAHLFDYMVKTELVLPSGDLLQTEAITNKILATAKGQRDRESSLYRKLSALVEKNKSTLSDLLDPTVLSPEGYASLATISSSTQLNLAPVLFGSQGSLAVITEVILRCDYLSEAPTYFFAEFPDIDSTLEFTASAASVNPATLDIYDLSILSEVSDAGKILRPFATDGLATGYLVALTLSDVKRRQRQIKLQKLRSGAKGTANASSTKETQGDFDELYSILLTYLNDTPTSARLPLVDGAFVPEERFGSYLAGVKNLEEKYNFKLPVFGSCLSHTYTVRPKIDLATVAGRQKVLGFLRDYHELLSGIGGSLAGDAPEGRVKAIVTSPGTDEKLVKIYKELKDIFDPHNILNPGIKQEVSLRSTIRNLRTAYDPGIIIP